MSTSNSSTPTNAPMGPASADPLGLNNPTPIILALVNKFVLCMLLVANSALFHTLALNKKSRIPPLFSVLISITFIGIAVIVCTYGTYEFSASINQYVAYCEINSGCLYTPSMLITSKNIYLFIAVSFSIACLSICILLLKDLASQF
jgi:hypothetical protein